MTTAGYDAEWMLRAYRGELDDDAATNAAAVARATPELLARWPEAAEALADGDRRWPDDPRRFAPVELGPPHVDADPDTTAAFDELVRDSRDAAVLRLVAASAVRADRPYWAWDRRIPVGGTTLMPGREGLGKTALTIWLMARLTRGQLPGMWWGRPADVVYIGTEDDRRSVLVPRLIAAGADLDKVHFVDMPAGLTFSVGVDCELLAQALAGRDVALVVVDPLDGHLIGTDTHRKSEVQQAVAQLAVLAQELRCGALGLAHLNKGDTRELLGRVVGSVGFTTSVRSVLGVGEHPDNPAERVCVVGKANMTDKATIPAVKFRVEKAFVDHPDGGDPIDTGLAVMLGEELGIDPNSVIDSGSPAERTALDEAVEWLGDVLGDGPQDSTDVKKWAKAADISERTLKRAMGKAGVVVGRKQNERGRPTVWELKGFGPRVSGQTPLARNQQAPDQEEHDETGGFRANPGSWPETPQNDGPKPPTNDGLDAHVDTEEW